MAIDDEDLDDDELEEEEDEDEDEEEQDDDDDEDLAVTSDDLLDDVADAITQGIPEAVEVDIEGRSVVVTMSDESRWKLTLTKL